LILRRETHLDQLADKLREERIKLIQAIREKAAKNKRT